MKKRIALLSAGSAALAGVIVPVVHTLAKK